MFKKFAAAALLVCALGISAFAAEVKPGLNLFTGTSSAFDFESDVSSVKFSGSAKDGVNCVVSKEKGGNSANHAASVEGSGGYVYFDVDFPTIEKERPIKVSYDYILGIGCSQIRTVINYPKPFSDREHGSFYISYHGAQTDETWRTASFERSAEKLYNFNGQTVYYQGGSDIVSMVFMNYSGADGISYFDNISLIPAYKITYDVNGGTGKISPSYFFNSSDVTLPDGSEIFRVGYSFKGWGVSADSKQAVTAVTAVPGNDITLYAIWEENGEDTRKIAELYDENGDFIKYTVAESGSEVVLDSGEYSNGRFLLGWRAEDGTLYGYRIPSLTENLKLTKVFAGYDSETKPGINIFANASFENGTGIDVRPSNGGVKIISEDSGNHCLEYGKGSGWASIQHMVQWEKGRKYRISYKMLADYSSEAIINVVAGNENHITSKKISADEWTQFSIDYAFDGNTAANDAISFYYNPGTDGAGRTVWYDDLELIPYYKVTYNLNGGSGIDGNEYFLGTEFELTSSIPTRKGFLFKGWSLKNGSVTAVSKVTAAPGKDIDVYAIWERVSDENAIVYDFTSNVPGVGNGTILVNAPDETAGYETVDVYFADNDGVLDGYTAYASMKLSDGSASYAVNSNRGFPDGVTRLAFVFGSDGKDDITYWYTIPEEHRFKKSGELLYSFWATSDLHLGTNYNSDYWSAMTVNKNNAMKDIFASDADFMFINGDVVNYGKTAYAKSMRAYLDEKLNNSEYNTKQIPVFLTNGNHEYMDVNNATSGFDLEPVHTEYLAQIEYLKENYPDVKITHDGENVWYAADIKGAKFIFLSSPEVTEDGKSQTYTMCDEQLEFLDEQLFDGEYSNKVSFVVTHVPLNKYVRANTSSGYEGGISNSSDIEKILAMHPNTVFCTGHSHSDLGNQSVDFVTVGDMTSKFTHLNDGCLVWIASTDGKGENNSSYITSYSTGMYIEVYSDKIVVNSRKFLENSLYFGHGIYIIPTQDAKANVAKAEISGTPADGAVLTAVLDGADSGNYTYQWIVDGEIVHNGKSWTVEGKSNYGGKYVYLRTVDENGYYASVKSEKPFSGAVVTYDINGGSGSVPKAQKVLAGEYAPDNSKFPKKDGCFFIGWSTDKNAVKPMAKINVENDVTLYAVYSTEPKFYFDASYSGFSANGQATYTAIENGTLVTKVENGSKDQYYTLSGISFNADDYPILRIKADIDGSGDGLFYAAKGGTYTTGAESISFSESSHFRFAEAPVAAEFNGYKVYEFDIKNMKGADFENWSGTVTALRYDALNSGTNITDYLVFTDKKGVFGAQITLNKDSDTAVLSENSENCTVGSVKRFGSTAQITLVPNSGYEFTTAEDVMDTVKVNGEKPFAAEVDANGNAVVTYVFPIETEFGSGSGKTVKLTIGKSVPSENSAAVVAVYGENSKFIGAKIISGEKNFADINVKIADSLGAKTVKAFCLGSLDKFSPLGEAVFKTID